MSISDIAGYVCEAIHLILPALTNAQVIQTTQDSNAPTGTYIAVDRLCRTRANGRSDVYMDGSGLYHLCTSWTGSTYIREVRGDGSLVEAIKIGLDLPSIQDYLATKGISILQSYSIIPVPVKLSTGKWATEDVLELLIGFITETTDTSVTTIETVELINQIGE